MNIATLGELSWLFMPDGIEMCKMNCDDCFEEWFQSHVDGDECEPPSGASDVSESAHETRCTRGEL